MSINSIYEKKGMIFNIQKYNTYDGPGIRTLVFLKGCPLRCKWCSNPEGLETKYQIMYNQELCNDCGKCISICPKGIHKEYNGKHIIDSSIDCIGCKKCSDICTENAISIVGEIMTVKEILDIVEEDEAFYRTSGGGITLGGGEALMQIDFAINIMRACKLENINTAIETSGHTRLENIMEIAKYTDLFLYDVKHMDLNKHNVYTGVDNKMILNNLKELLSNGYNVKVRMPLMKNINTDKEYIEKLINFLLPFKNKENFKGIDLLPYHKMGVSKYKRLGKEYELKEDIRLNNEELKTIEGLITEHGLDVNIINH